MLKSWREKKARLLDRRRLLAVAKWILSQRPIAGRSKVAETVLDEYVADGLLHRTMRDWCCAPGHEEVPQPEPYEAIVFWDFFKSGLWFPCEDFVGEVLQHFDL
jgi:hypothetical protein